MTLPLLITNFSADANSCGKDKRTPLHWAATLGHLNMVKNLVEYGADISLVDYFGRTPLDDAKNRGQKSIVKFLEALAR